MIFTIGHSIHPIERFIQLLQTCGITTVTDVRSSPFSRFNPQFNRERLKVSLQDSGISYLFLGEELGARTKDPDCYEHGRVSYEKLANTQLFKAGLKRLKAGGETQTIALMCAEKDPLNCHRTILVTRELENEGVSVSHILSDGSIEPHHAAMSRLKQELKLPEHDMFRSDKELLEEAYRLQSRKIAYVEETGSM